MIKPILYALKRVLRSFGLDVTRVAERLNMCSVHLALRQNGFGSLIERLRKIQPDISQQYSSRCRFNDYYELKLRSQHAFQCSLTLKVLENFPSGKLNVVDIGDSAGTHMIYLRELTRNRFHIDSTSVNLDRRAIEKIKVRGLKTMLCRAEDLDLKGQQVDLFVSFQMLEHLHNPALFFRHLAKKSQGNNLLITVPYMKRSRTGLHHIRNNVHKTIFAEEEHIFELSPEDWTLLMLHSGWKVIYSKVYYQYPRKWPLISRILALYWREIDFEGFWGAILEKDTTYCDYYQSWEG